MRKTCKVCTIKKDSWQGEAFGQDNSLRIVKYGNNYMLQHGTGWYDEYDSYDIESEIEFCPKCGRNLKNKEFKKIITGVAL